MTKDEAQRRYWAFYEAINLCFEFKLLLCNNPFAFSLAMGKYDMTRDEIQSEVLRVFKEQFEIANPDLDENLREAYEFDSIDAIELLREIEVLLGTQLTRDEKKMAMDIRTINQILDYIESLAAVRSNKS
jgi:acyl carrier protein